MLCTLQHLDRYSLLLPFSSQADVWLLTRATTCDQPGEGADYSILQHQLAARWQPPDMAYLQIVVHTSFERPGLSASTIKKALLQEHLVGLHQTVLTQCRLAAGGCRANSRQPAAAWLACQPHHRQGHPALPRCLLACHAHVLWPSCACQGLGPRLHHQGTVV